MTRRPAALLAVLVAAVGLAGCGVGAGSSDAPQDVAVVVTCDFGARQLRGADADSVPSSETVMRFIQRRFDVTTRYSGGFVESIDGLSGGRDAEGRPLDWFYYVNGIEAGKGAASRSVSPGDRIWWDRHTYGATQRVPAVVGSWPEPFRSGSEGKKIPLAVVCEGEARSCDEVETRLAEEDVKRIARTGIGSGVGQKLLRIIVGPWSAIRNEPAARQLERGPQASGVFARLRADRFELLDQDGKIAQTQADAVGLVAATRFGEQQPTWIVTGTDDAGVAAAAAALRSDVLSNHFAVAIIKGRALPLPVRQDP
ncbi:MAG: DUF4430 domain-containing protein [Solirubrobacteraceae bacterium]